MPNMIASIAIIVTETGRCLNDSLSVLNQVICIGSTYIEINYSLLLKIFLYFYVEDLSLCYTIDILGQPHASILNVRK